MGLCAKGFTSTIPAQDSVPAEEGIFLFLEVKKEAQEVKSLPKVMQ